ncbi:CRE-CLEC-140 protein [Caenorhabditis remanei]|uniref:CRE-CLEC-140 protein n=1 Tax=Caenorhabditis remanei TaxID=31234 RepID=E3M988_CAERE|nr:CRE-CLEC-140 protein [Caenorhabditis remanei]
MNSHILFALFSLFCSTYAASTPVCRDGFKLVNRKKCLKSFPDYKLHDEAEAVCRGYGGTLVTIKNAADNRAVSDLAGGHSNPFVWLGVYCFSNVTTSCYLDDNSGPLTYSNFATGYPKRDAQYGGCVYMTTYGPDVGKWFSSPCEYTGLEYVCEVPSTVDDKACTHNYNGNCYLPSHELSINTPNTTYQTAQNICKSINARLVSIHSKSEIDYIKSLYTNSGIQQITLGAQAFMQDTFDWTDGSSFDFDNFDPLATTKGNCLQMDLSSRVDNGMWSQINCQTVNYFVCKRKAGVAVTVAKKEEQEEEEEEKDVNPKFKFQMVTEKRELPIQHLDLSDLCNSTLFIAPGVITSFGYPAAQPPITYCTWKVAVVGAYRLGIYFTDFSVMYPVNIYVEKNNLLASPKYEMKPFSVLAPYNMVTLTHDSAKDAELQFHGFSATILPY